MIDLKNKSPYDFLKEKKGELVNNKYRLIYQSILDEVKSNLVKTNPQKQTIDETKSQMVLLTIPKGNGQNDFLTLPRVFQSKGQEYDVPRSQMPIVFSKVVTAISIVLGNIPDGVAHSINKIKARAYHDLWKASWADVEKNGLTTLQFAALEQFLTGTGVWRIYPKREETTVTKNGKQVPKILYDDIYREPLDMNRTWLGLSYKPYSDNNRPEVLWEIDITKDDYAKLKKRFKKRGKRKNTGASVTEEARSEDGNKNQTHVTLSFYENPMENCYIVCSSEDTFYSGDLPNEEVYGSTIITHAMNKDFQNPYGVGFWELMRGNEAIQNYISSLNTQQVATEIEPVIWASGNIQGDMFLKRSSNYVNTLPAGVKLDKLTTTGNSTLGMNYIEVLKKQNDDITGINDIVAGASGANTLGETVILKEAALARLMWPRNSLARGLEKDFIIFQSWLEQDQIKPREFIFNSEEEVKSFMDANPSFNHESSVDTDENGIPEHSVFSAPNVKLSFDYSKPHLEESDYQDSGVVETGHSSRLVPRNKVVEDMSNLDKDMGYDKVILVVDPASMIVPSQEIQKQVSMQLYPIIQNALMQIFGLAKTDPEQAKAQLKSFNTFMDSQKQNVYDYIPKEAYDAIIGGEMAPPPMPPGMPGQPMPGDPNAPMVNQQGQPMGPNNTPVGTPGPLPSPNMPFAQAAMGSGASSNMMKAVSKRTK